MALPWRRKVMLDTNVIYSSIRDPDGSMTGVVDKSLEEDDLQMTSVNYDECMDTARKSEEKARKKGVKPQMTARKMKSGLDDIVERTRSGEVEHLDVPDQDVLQRRYRIRDESDYKILYAADETDTEILVTSDKDYYDPMTKGPENTRMMKPSDYVNEGKDVGIVSRIARRLGR